MKTRYKYLAVNIVWCLILSTLINIICYLKLNDIFSVTIKVEVVLLILSSLLSQLDHSKKDDKDFSRGFHTMRSVFYAVFCAFLVGWTCILLLHCLFDYSSFYFQKYMFAVLVGLTFSVFICRIYLSN